MKELYNSSNFSLKMSATINRQLSRPIPILHKGFLQKKSTSKFGGWKSKYLILEAQKLKYFLSDSEKDV